MTEMFLVVPDGDTSKEFVAADMAEAHGTCYARGYKTFDTWTLPNKREAVNPALPGLFDDGSQPIQFGVQVVRPAEESVSR